MSLKKQAANSLKWLIGSTFVSRFILTGSVVVLARLLNPSIFGLYTLAFVVIDALMLFKSMGFDAALIRHKKDIAVAADTAFMIIPIFGIVLFFILYFSAPLVASFFDHAKLIPILRTIGVVFVFSCLGKVPHALLEKNMQFAKVSMINVIGIVLYAVSAIVFALCGFGIWSLVYGYILRSAANVILGWHFSGWRPRFSFDKKIAWEMFHFGKYLFLGSVVYFLRENFDKVIIGKILGVSLLGLYGISFRLTHFFRVMVGTKVYKVFFPAFSRIQDKKDALKSAFLKVFQYLCLGVIPFGVVLFLLSYEILKLIYGEKWLAAAGVVKILAIAGVFNTLPTCINPIFNALNRPKIGFYINLFQIGLFFIFVAPCARLFGVSGVAWVIAAASFIAFFMYLFWIRRLLAIDMKELVEAVKIPVLCSLFMGIGILLIKNVLSVAYFGANINFYLSSTILFVAGFLVYIAALLVTAKPLVMTLTHLFFYKRK